MSSVQQNVIKHKVGLLNLVAERWQRILRLQGDGLFTRYLLSLSDRR
ncbi:MAG: hypothetical protein DID91_2727702765 [Candidatus Nitrotoga sp. MKT]|nr:MAG: hypothetical protein DID91_2727702765 [Candidatus Nitrotoga sp. MKT]